MRKLGTLIVILTVFIFASQVVAQVDSKTQGTGTTNTTTNKTEDPKVFSPDKSTTGKTSQGTTNTTGQGTVTTAKPVKTGQIFDAGRNLIYSYDQMGFIRDAKNRVFCQLTPQGEIIKKRTVVGSVEKGIFRDRYGKEYARIVQEGKVVDAKSKTLGTVQADGNVLDGKGAKIGSAPGVDKNAVVITFFFKEVLDAKPVKNPKK